LSSSGVQGVQKYSPQLGLRFFEICVHWQLSFVFPARMSAVVATTRILGISGSLRSGSLNTAVLSAAAILAPPDTEIVLYTGLSDLPAFNPDLDTAEPPLVV
jgi:hypothetical protein